MSQRIIFIVIVAVLICTSIFLGALFTVTVDGALMNYHDVIPDTNGEWARREFIGAALIIALLWLRTAYMWGCELRARRQYDRC
jgi:hypothetical protein